MIPRACDRRPGGGRRWRAALASALLAGPVLAAAPGDLAALPGGPVEPRPAAPVAASLIADVAAIQPGRAFRVGVLLGMPKGWHVYWKNPGDAGMATFVTFGLPKGFRAGELRWPVPRAFRQAGGIVTYGYEDEVLLWREVTPPKDLAPGSTVELRADVAYLACKEQCVPGEAGLRLRLPVAAAARPAGGELFERWRGRLPIHPADTDRLASAAVRGHVPPGRASGAFEIVLRWTFPPEKVEWYPEAGSTITVESVSVSARGRRTRITFSVALPAPSGHTSRTLESLVVYTDAAGARRAVSVPVPLSQTKADPPPPVRRASGPTNRSDSPKDPRKGRSGS